MGMTCRRPMGALNSYFLTPFSSHIRTSPLQLPDTSSLRVPTYASWVMGSFAFIYLGLLLAMAIACLLCSQVISFWWGKIGISRMIPWLSPTKRESSEPQQQVALLISGISMASSHCANVFTKYVLREFSHKTARMPRTMATDTIGAAEWMLFYGIGLTESASKSLIGHSFISLLEQVTTYPEGSKNILNISEECRDSRESRIPEGTSQIRAMPLAVPMNMVESLWRRREVSLSPSAMLYLRGS